MRPDLLRAHSKSAAALDFIAGNIVVLNRIPNRTPICAAAPLALEFESQSSHPHPHSRQGGNKFTPVLCQYRLSSGSR